MRTSTHKRMVAADDYLELVRRFPLRPIRSRSEYEQAAAILIEMAERAGEFTPGENDYMDVLGRMVREYDQLHSSVLKLPKPTPIEMLKYLMEEHGMNTVSLGKLVGGSGQASMILSGKRELSKANIRTLAAHFNVSPALFI